MKKIKHPFSTPSRLSYHTYNKKTSLSISEQVELRSFEVIKIFASISLQLRIGIIVQWFLGPGRHALYIFYIEIHNKRFCICMHYALFRSNMTCDININVVHLFYMKCIGLGDKIACYNRIHSPLSEFSCKRVLGLAWYRSSKLDVNISLSFLDLFFKKGE